MRRLFALVAVVGLFAVTAAPAQAVTKDVTVGDNFFDPDRVKVVAGGSIHWTREGTGNSHNVSSDDGLFRNGNPQSGAINYTVVFSAGTFPYRCEVHGSLGMTGVVRVPAKITAGPSGLPFTVRWAKSASQTGSEYDVQYRIGGGAWNTWKTDTTKLKGVFGKNDSPIEVKNGVKYSFRARSQDGGDMSNWSPVRSFNP